MILAPGRSERRKKGMFDKQKKHIYLHKARAPPDGHLKRCVCGCGGRRSRRINPHPPVSQSSPSSSFPITCIGSSERTREYHPPRGVAASSISPEEVPFIGAASGALRPDVAYSVTRKTMCAYSKNAMLYCTHLSQIGSKMARAAAEGGRWKASRGEGKQNKTYLNMIRMYVTWSIPLSWTYCSSSSVADINNRPAATKSYRDFVASAFSFEKR